MSDDPRFDSLRRDLDRLLQRYEDIQGRVNELEKESGMTNKAVEMEVKALYQLAESLSGNFEDYAKGQIRETGKLSDSHEQILKELGEVQGRISVIQDKMTQSDVEVNVGEQTRVGGNVGGDVTGRDKTDGTNTIKWLVVGVGLIAAIAIAFSGGFVKLPGGVEVGGAGQTPAPITQEQ